MTKIDKSKLTGITKEKKLAMKKMSGRYSSLIDWNKVRDDYKNEKD